MLAPLMCAMAALLNVVTLQTPSTGAVVEATCSTKSALRSAAR